MSKARPTVNWHAMLGERLPAVVERLTPGRLVLLADREPSQERLNSHPQPELCVVLRGKVRVRTTGAPIALGANSALLVAPHMYHLAQAEGRSAETVWFSATPNHMGTSLARVDSRGVVEATGAVDFLTFVPGNRLLCQLIGEVTRRERGWLLVAKALMNQLFVQALRRLDTDGRALPAFDEWSAAEIVTHEARIYMQRNYRHPLTLAQVAHHVALSPNYLATLFKRQLGRTIIDFLTEMRIEEAKRLLAETDRKVAEIAYQVGYHSPYYFSRAFRKVVGRSPKAFREAAKS